MLGSSVATAEEQVGTVEQQTAMDCWAHATRHAVEQAVAAKESTDSKDAASKKKKKSEYRGDDKGSDVSLETVKEADSRSRYDGGGNGSRDDINRNTERTAELAESKGELSKGATVRSTLHDGVTRAEELADLKGDAGILFIAGHAVAYSKKPPGEVKDASRGEGGGDGGSGNLWITDSGDGSIRKYTRDAFDDWARSHDLHAATSVDAST